MAFRLQRLLIKEANNLKCTVRYKSGRKNLGKKPGEAKNLEQRLSEYYYKDPEIHYKVNIGFAVQELKNREHAAEQGKFLRGIKQNPELEKLSRTNALRIPLDQVEKYWQASHAPFHVKAIAEHYAVFEHLFGDAFFYPIVGMEINFTHKDKLIPVYWGNALKPEEVTKIPRVNFDSNPDSLWTLMMTTPDGHLSEEKMEYCHWFVGNIRGNDFKTGDTVIDYMQPLPLQGLGYLRYIFVLFKQEKQIDYSSLKLKSKKNTLEERSFSTYDFYKERQDLLTPAGLSFFTADWDESVRSYFNKSLNLDCPKFSYDFPEHYYTKQKWFPLRQPFNLYLDRYRDQKEIAKEYLLKKLKVTHPFEKPPKPLPFPNAIPFKPGTPYWLKTELKKERLKQARAKDYL